MKRFIGKNFLLRTDTARGLYHGVAAELPICDYHCHIPAEQIARNEPFSSITQLWLGGDHYKWRAMRFSGVPEDKITGNASDEEKFTAWAHTVPRLIGNPLYHWTHLELQRYFDIDIPLSPRTAPDIWHECNRQLQTLRPQDLIAKSNVKLICTTDDPADSLEWHQRLRDGGNDSGATVLPAWRPDRAMDISGEGFGSWLDALERCVGFEIPDFETFKRALSLRIEYFHASGCRLCDHALDTVPIAEPNDMQAHKAFASFRQDGEVQQHLVNAYRSTLLVFLATEYSRLGWTMQLHIGALRNMNVEMRERLGPDSGFDGIADAPIARPLLQLLQAIQERSPLPRTLLFTLNDKDNYTLGAISGAMQKSGVAAHVSPGPAWWFHDQRDGMRKHIRNLASVTPLSEFIGMTTDSRSLLSYTRHEYFRRIFCDMLGDWVENGEYPNDIKTLTAIVQKVCYKNAMQLFQNVL